MGNSINVGDLKEIVPSDASLGELNGKTDVLKYDAALLAELGGNLDGSVDLDQLEGDTQPIIDAVDLQVSGTINQKDYTSSIQGVSEKPELTPLQLRQLQEKIKEMLNFMIELKTCEKGEITTNMGFLKSPHPYFDEMSIDWTDILQKCISKS